MAKKLQTDWEKAARALCRFDGIPENIVRDGKPMWAQYLLEARAVLVAIDRFDTDWKPDAKKESGG